MNEVYCVVSSTLQSLSVVLMSEKIRNGCLFLPGVQIPGAPPWANAVFDVFSV